jgi:hypothetical protein
MPRPRQELLDLVHHPFRVAGPQQVIISRQLDVFRVWDLMSQEPSRFNVDANISLSMDNKRGHSD